MLGLSVSWLRCTNMKLWRNNPPLCILKVENQSNFLPSGRRQHRFKMTAMIFMEEKKYKFHSEPINQLRQKIVSAYEPNVF